MSDDDKQPDNTLQQTEEPMAVAQDKSGSESATPEVDLSAASDLESPLNGDEPSVDGSASTTATDEAEISEVQAVESSTDVPSAETDIAAWEALKDENQALTAQLNELNQQFEALKTQSMRMAADFDNFRKRTSKEKEDLEHQVKKNTLAELLPVVDNFERARSHIKPQTDGEMTIHKSYQGVYKQLVECLKRIGVSPMRPEGAEFDPNLHEAVMREATHEYPEGVVIEQLMRGYFLGDRVLRHAMVKVAAAAEPVVTSEEGTPETTEP
ncbi:MAG TPA: nucleotide exchange factor GrpE [Cyanobacteria bacterium UBA11370]|nr:nucleotide exchange factor GrpE [Cyanobacteria bacterium UBA11370]